MNILAILATIGGIFMSMGYYPQAIKTLKRKSVKDISLATSLMFFPGIILWLLYGLSIKNLPLIISNIIAGAGCGFVLVVYYLYRKK